VAEGQVGIYILALLSGGYESRKDANPTRRSASQADLPHVVSANRDSQYVYRELWPSVDVILVGVVLFRGLPMRETLPV
jgi:hypothetical protein